MTRRPVVFIHGYSRDDSDFARLRAALMARGHAESDLYVAVFRSFSDQVSVRRLADALDAAIDDRLGRAPFDAVVHSAGALVMREWLRQVPHAAQQLRNLVAIAPANFGSPVARLARSPLGRASMAFGRVRSRDFDFVTPWSENFLEVGERLLRDLELASPISWTLAESEITDSRWGEGDGSSGAPRVFTIGGLAEYGDFAMRRRRPGSGTDGTVRLAGIPLDVDRLRLDLRPTVDDDAERIVFDRAPERMARPLFVTDLNHLTVCTGGDPDDGEVGESFALVVDGVARALEVDSAEEYADWSHAAVQTSTEQMSRTHRWSWQQFVVRMRDEAGEGVDCEWTLQLEVDGRAVGWLEKGAHTNSARPDLRCLDVPVTDELANGQEVVVRVMLDPETEHFAYRGIGGDTGGGRGLGAVASIAVPVGPEPGSIRLFRSMATTLIDIVIEGVPPDPRSSDAMLRFVD